MTAVYVTVLSGSTVSGSFTWWLPALTLLSLVAWAAFGCAVGLVVSPIIGYPVSLLFPYLAMTFPAAWEPLWLRHLSGLVIDCCSTSDVMNPRVIYASGSMMLALTVVSGAVIAVRLGPARAQLGPPIVALAVGVLAAIGSVAVASPLGASVTKPRNTQELVCKAAVCLWPEDDRSRVTNEQAWKRITQAWARTLSAPLPTRIGPVATDSMLPLTSLTMVDDDAVLSMAVSLPYALSDCQGEPPAQYWDAATQLSLHIAHGAGVGFAAEATLGATMDASRQPQELQTIVLACGR